MGTLIQSFLMIFIAEMGDKTQILAMTFATKYKMRDILLGVAAGSALNHGLAIILGALLTRVIPIDAMGIIAGLLFLYFGYASLVIEDDDVEEEKSFKLPIVTVALAFFIGELGDKTQLTALTLSTQFSNGFLVLAGTVSGMVMTSLIGIIIGKTLGNKIPEAAMKIGAFAIFTFFGLEKLISSIYRDRLPLWTQLVIFGIILVILLWRFKGFRVQASAQRESLLRRRAELLKEYMDNLSVKTEELCLGESACETCAGSGCLVGYMRDVLSHGLVFGIDQKKVQLIRRESLSIEKCKEMMEILIEYYDKYPEEFDNNQVLKEIRETLLVILGISMTSTSYDQYKKEWKEVK